MIQLKLVGALGMLDMRSIIWIQYRYLGSVDDAHLNHLGNHHNWRPSEGVRKKPEFAINYIYYG